MRIGPRSLLDFADLSLLDLRDRLLPFCLSFSDRLRLLQSFLQFQLRTRKHLCDLPSGPIFMAQSLRSELCNWRGFRTNWRRESLGLREQGFQPLSHYYLLRPQCCLASSQWFPLPVLAFAAFSLVTSRQGSQCKISSLSSEPPRKEISQCYLQCLRRQLCLDGDVLRSQHLG